MLDHTGDQIHIDAAGSAQTLQLAAQAIYPHRCRAVRNLAPALRAAHHATGDHREPWLGVKPITTGLIKGQLEAVLTERAMENTRGIRQRHYAVGQCALIQHCAA